jgi:CheY-like chemotaxis protein
LQLPSSATLASAEPDPLPREVLPAARGDYHVLLVEDHADSARVLARFLKMWGYQVDVAGSCAAALQTAENVHFDLLISDIGLPDGSGHDLMRALLNRRPIKGIALTGFGMDDDLRRARDAGFTEHLTKPVTVDRLRVVIERVLSEVA